MRKSLGFYLFYNLTFLKNLKNFKLSKLSYFRAFAIPHLLQKSLKTLIFNINAYLTAKALKSWNLKIILVV
ncbi:MAG: hypothetical protein PUB96_06760 [Helicobacteraceae bacterium]|nr:hypothetical protein [Helicobacteraceae bacterium]